MSFRCERCTKAQEPGTKPVRDVIKIRKRVYGERHKQLKNGKRILIDGGGKGWEIAQEQRLCPKCGESKGIVLEELL